MFTLEDNREEVKQALEEAIYTALEAVGMQAEGDVKKTIRDENIVDTGLLRNSITYAVIGHPTNINSYQSGNKNRAGKAIAVKAGTYDSGAIDDGSGQKKVFIGTNVEYAPYVELGTGPYFQTPPEWEQFTSDRGSGEGHGYVKPRPFLKPAIENHISEYKKIIKNGLED